MNIYRNSEKALEIAEKKQNESLNQMLITGIEDCFGKTVINGYEYFNSLPREKKKILLDSFGYDIDGYKVVKCTEFHYAEFINDETSNLESKYDIKVIPYRLEERENYIFMFTNNCPQEYVLFDNLYLSPSPERYRVIESFEYDSTYEDNDGNTHYWMDTDEVYYGNIPPNTDENSRWMLAGYNEDRTERKFKLQRKQ